RTAVIGANAGRKELSADPAVSGCYVLPRGEVLPVASGDSIAGWLPRLHRGSCSRPARAPGGSPGAAIRPALSPRADRFGLCSGATEPGWTASVIAPGVVPHHRPTSSR